MRRNAGGASMSEHPLEYMINRLVELTRHAGWGDRRLMFDAGLDTIAEIASHAQGQRRRRIVRECAMDKFARGVVEAFEAPAVASYDQAYLYALSSDPKHQAMASEWLTIGGLLPDLSHE